MSGRPGALGPWGGWSCLDSQQTTGTVTGFVGLESAVKGALRGGAADSARRSVSSTVYFNACMKKLAEEFKSEITNTPLGNISKPIILTQGILIFKVRDTRKLKKFKNLDDKKNYLVNAEKNKILKMYSLTHYDKLKRSTPIKYYYFNE